MATYGWAGKILRVNTGTGAVSTEDTMKYKEFLGGRGFGYKILYDEVPMDTKAYDEASKVIISVGPLTGSGVPCSGRTTMSFLSSWSKGYSVVDAHMGGHFAHAMKYAGYDAIIVEGQSKNPVYLKIEDDKVTLEDATFVWGKGTKDTLKMIGEKDGPEFTVTTIGQAGENLVNMSLLATSNGNVGGAGVGAIFGSKKLKAISVRGTGSVKVADPKKLKELCDYQLKELIGANNNHNVPSVPQSWAEFSSTTKNRWQGAPGRCWELAEGGPVDTGEQPVGDITKVGFRATKAVFDCGEVALQYLVKQSGCSSCPIRCYPSYDVGILKEYDLPTIASNTCGGYGHEGYYAEGVKDFKDEGDSKVVLGAAGSYAADDYGVWNNYGNLARDFVWCYKQGVLEKVLPKEEYDSIPWQLMKDGDPRWVVDFMRRIAMKEGEFSHLGDGTYLIAERWNLGTKFYDSKGNQNISYNGYPKHHANEDAGQAGLLTNLGYNRDCMVHCLTNFIRSGTPFDIIKRNAEEIWGEGCIDPPKNYTPMNRSKAKMAKWGLINKQWHDMATVCNWMYPMTLSPSKERGYRGDLTLDAQYMAAVTGEDYTPEKVDFYTEKVTQMLRVMTAISFNEKSLRTTHDLVPAWVFDQDPDVPAFSEGTDKMDRADWETALDMFYEEMGWEKASGIPTRATLEKFDLKDMADDLEKRGLLPA